MKSVVVTGLVLMFVLEAQEFTRGIGVYPGDPKENFAPSMHVDATAYRNLALRRAAFQSSAYDYNLTAQLITDGIKETAAPRWVAVSTSTEGSLKKNQREWPIDDNWTTSVEVKGTEGWVQIEIGGDSPPQVDRIDVDASVQPISQPEAFTFMVAGSDDGKTWNDLGRTDSVARPSGGAIGISIPLSKAANRFYRVRFESGRSFTWHIGEIGFFNGGKRVHAGGPYNFNSAWKSAGNGEEWVYVDLGAPCTFDRFVLYWIRRAVEGSVQVSGDAQSWTTIEALPASNALTDDLKLSHPAQGRYVRVLMTKAAFPADGYILSELEVYGRGGPLAQPKPAPAVQSNGRLDLAGGAWKLERALLVAADGEALSQPGFQDSGWLVATVPGTVLTSYFNAGAVADPNFGDNQLTISDSFFYSDFWYRNEFVAPAVSPGRNVWLHFDGINWKADVFVNGEKIGRIEGGFMRGRFDVSRHLHPGQKNAIAVRIEKNATPGSAKQKTFENPDKNGGPLGADNPTFHASIGWDWIPTIRGRNSGIWNNVYLTSTGPVTIENPFVSTTLPLPDTSSANVSIQVTLRNHSESPLNGNLVGRFGDAQFSTPVALDPASAKTLKLDPSNTPVLRLQNPKLWWPNGYGDPNLYRVELRFEAADKSVSDSQSFLAGVRQFTYSEDGGVLKIWINGRRFVPRGGNWGFSESMLRYRAREYDVAVRYHRDMNFTMIRNWVGQIGEDAFYEACDRWGIVVWQDFWLANPWDGPDPDNDALFLSNARDTIERIRNHPSIGLYVGRNEGYPPKTIEDGLSSLIAGLHPGLHYIPGSADGVVGGRGPYMALPSTFYFSQRATTKLHSEMGMPNIVTMDSLRLMMPASAMWPQGLMWGLHDFCLNGAQGGASFRQRIDKSYGGASTVEDWVSLAQFVNYEGHRAMFEAQSKNRMGLLIWMSHPAWPSLVWQSYDYYFEPTAAYFGMKKASEPLHIQWNPVDQTVEVVNYSVPNASGLTASADLLNLDGAAQWHNSVPVDSSEDSTVAAMKITPPSTMTPVSFLRLKLSRGSEIVSENFYWLAVEPNNYTALRTLPKVNVEAVTHTEQQGSKWRLTTELHNASSQPALMVRLKAVRSATGDRILPALYSDNYVSLMPGERRTIVTELDNADTRGEAPRIAIEGFNTVPGIAK